METQTDPTDEGLSRVGTEVRAIGTQATPEDIAKAGKKQEEHAEAERMRELIRLAAGDHDELASAIAGEWPKATFTATKETEASIQATRETRAIVIREGDSVDEGKLAFIERQFPGADSKQIAETLKIGGIAKLESTSRISMDTSEEGNALSPPHRVLLIGKIEAHPTVGPIDYRAIVNMLQRIDREMQAMDRTELMLKPPEADDPVVYRRKP